MMNPGSTQVVIPREATQRRLRMALWTAQVLLAVSFLITGSGKVAEPMDALIASTPWIGAVPPGIVRLIGLCELAGALGLVVPAAMRIKPLYTGYAAVGLALLMGMATLFHLARTEYGNIVGTVVLGTIAVFIAWGRLEKAPIAPRPLMYD